MLYDRHGLALVPPITCVSPTVARSAGYLSLIVKLHHPDLQEFAEKEQDQLVLAVGEWWSHSVDGVVTC